MSYVLKGERERKKNLLGKARTSMGKLANKTKQRIFASVISFVKSGSWIIGMSLLLGLESTRVCVAGGKGGEGVSLYSCSSLLPHAAQVSTERQAQPVSTLTFLPLLSGTQNTPAQPSESSTGFL